MLCYVPLFWHGGTYRIIPLHYVPYVCGNGTYSVFSGIICPGKQKKRDIGSKFSCICPSEQKKRDIADKFLYICPEREKKKIQSADFHTYANIQKAMCIKNPATEGGKDILWRIYKKNRFRELFLVGTDSTPTPFVKIQQPLLF